jgi:hypothetical protein
MTNKQLKQAYDKVVSEYIAKFCKKQECELEFWVADTVGGIACFGDVMYFNFSAIKHDIDTRQPAGLILEWLYASIDNPDKNINYYSYSKGLRYSDIRDH